MQRYLLLGCLLIGLLMLPVVAMAQEAEDEAVSAETDAPVIHTVVSGDTFYSIAEAYNTTIPELERINNLAPDAILQIGQEIVVSGIVPLPIGAAIIDDAARQFVAGLPDIPKLHTVQGGESIGIIAEQYVVDIDDLLRANQLDLETPLQIGQQILIPGLAGDLIARDYVVRFGDTLAGIAAQFNTKPDLLLTGESLLNPSHMVAGQSIRIVTRTGSADPEPLSGSTHIVQKGETLFAIAAQHNQSPQAVAAANGLIYPTPLVEGQRLRIAGEGVYQLLSAELTTLLISRDELRKGEAFSLYIELATPSDDHMPTGRIQLTDIISTPLQSWYNTEYEQTFEFVPFDAGYVAVVGLDSFTHPGLYELALFTDGDESIDFVQTVRVADVPYGFQQISIADATQIRAADDAFLTPIYETVTPTPTFPITLPLASPLADGFRSAAYGAARSYAGAPVSIYHTGVDFAAPVNTPIRAVADGMVVFSNLTDLRGNLVILDHGLGVMTSYSHMAALSVAVGEFVTTGTAIGSLGNTGQSTGAHLHWEARVRNVPINAQQWLLEPILPALNR